MTLVRESSVRWNGLSTDTKPSSPPTGSKFLETDTGIESFYTGSEWAIQTLTPDPTYQKWGGQFFRGNATTTAMGQLAVGMAFFGTITALQGDANIGVGTRVDTTSTINLTAGARYTTWTSRRNNPWMKFRMYVTQVTDCRVFIGFHSSTGSNPTTSADPLNALSGAALWYDSGVSGNWKIMHNDGTGASTVVDTVGVAAAAGNIIVQVRAVDATPKFEVKLGTGSWVAVTTDLPAQTTALGAMIIIENLAAAKTLDLRSVYTQDMLPL